MPPRVAPIHVHKLGGAALADARAIRRAVALLRTQPGASVVVVSALAGVTDQLLEAARRAANGEEGALVQPARELAARHRAVAIRVTRSGSNRRTLVDAIDRSFAELEALARGLAILKELSPKTSDYIVARGERLSARIVAAALAEAGVRSAYVDATDVIRCDGRFGGASPELRATDRAARAELRPLIRRRVIPVVPGFLGQTPTGHVATLGRGGSDLTATLLARALGAKSVSLWKDVPGLLTADPHIVPDARVIPQLTPREAAELAYYGAKVLHPRALIPLGDRRIPLRVRPFASPDAAGTEVSRRATLRLYPVKALSAVGHQALITVTGNGMLGVPGIAARAFGALHAEGVSVSLISQASSEHSICFTVPEASAELADRALREAFRAEIAHREIDGVEVVRGMTTLAVVGHGMSGTPGIAARVFEALAAAGINIVAIAQGSSELNISCVVSSGSAPQALRRIHATFQLDRIGGGSGAARDRSDVILLGFGQIGREVSRLVGRAKGRTARLRLVGVIDRSGYVFDPDGLGQRRVALLARDKARGVGVGQSAAHRIRSGARPHGRAAAGVATEAVRAMAAHALSHPILVDVTADDTAAVWRMALTGGMDVVTANKRPLAGPLDDARMLRALALREGRRLLDEATVGAGLPIIDTFHKLVASHDRILRIEGCTSGTLGFLMSEIGRGKTFSESLRRAMSLGFTEPDPRDDLSGMDVARKALILGRLIGFRGEIGDVQVESLVPASARGMSQKAFLARLGDFDDEWRERYAAARRTGRVMRYVATATARRVAVELRAVPLTSPFAGLKGADNQVVFTTRRYKEHPLVISGPGAGPAVTAAGVLNDILKAAGSPD